MTSISKYACALVLTGGLASPALAASGDAGNGPTTGATSTNDSGSGPSKGAAANAQSPTQNGQPDANANSSAGNRWSANQESANPSSTPEIGRASCRERV